MPIAVELQLINVFQGATCYQLLVQDKPGWLGPRLLQRILDQAAQSKKEAENQRTYHRLLKDLRDDKVEILLIFDWKLIVLNGDNLDG